MFTMQEVIVSAIYVEEVVFGDVDMRSSPPIIF